MAAKKAYKGFKKDLTCLGKQYKIGRTETEDDAVPCKKGMHYCDYPLDCLGYYPPGSSCFCEVQVENFRTINDPDNYILLDDTKGVSEKLTPEKGLNLWEMAAASIQYIRESQDPRVGNIIHSQTFDTAINGQPHSAAISSGTCNMAACTGRESVSLSEGRYSIAATTGRGSLAACNNIGSIAATVGNYSAAVSRCGRSAAICADEGSAALSTGPNSIAVSIGVGSDATNTEYSGTAVSIMHRSTAKNHGAGGVSLATGSDSSAISTSTRNVSISTGFGSLAEANGFHSFAISTGVGGRAKAALGNWITLAEWDADRREIIDVKSVKVDGDKIQADTEYRLVNGEFVEFFED